MPYEPTNLACDHFLADFSDFVDDRLGANRRAELQAHIDCCEACLRHLAAYRRGIAVYRAAEPIVQDPGAFYARLEHRIWHDRGVGGNVIARRTSSWTNHPAWAVAAAAVIVGVFYWAGWQRDASLGQSAGGERVPIVVVSRVDDTPAVDVSDAKTPIVEAVATALEGEAAPIQLASASPGMALARDARDDATPRINFANDTGSLAVPQDEIAGYFEALEARMDANSWSAPAATSDGWIQPIRRGAMSYTGRSLSSVPINSLVVDAALILP